MSELSGGRKLQVVIDMQTSHAQCHTIGSTVARLFVADARDGSVEGARSEVRYATTVGGIVDIHVVVGDVG